MDRAIPEVVYNPVVDKELVLVSIPALADAFFRGIDAFLIDVFSDKTRAPIVETRVNKLVLSLPVSKDVTGPEAF
ncbi:MAG: hypothetical protein AABN33_27865 [Acidobacteriota bacterium]